MESSAATPTADIYCKQCGYDLRASGEAGRCPECGRAFAPDDPTTFRPRPLGEWKRALGRWAKRLAILLLVLGLPLGGTWGWFYWGWQQEQAVLAQAGDSMVCPWEPLILGGAAGRWLHDRHVPGSFVLERVHGVLGMAPATDADLLPLRKLTEIRSLTVSGPITDAGLVHLARFPWLRRLSLQETRVTGAGLVELAKLPALQCLNLPGTPITDAGLVHLAQLTALHRLDLSRTGITDAGLVHLEKLTALTWLDLTGTQVTPAGTARLKAALPGCYIRGP